MTGISREQTDCVPVEARTRAFTDNKRHGENGEQEACAPLYNFILSVISRLPCFLAVGIPLQRNQHRSVVARWTNSKPLNTISRKETPTTPPSFVKIFSLFREF